VHAVRGVSFAVRERETIGIVGESGCGKSVTALAILGLVPPPNGRVSGGGIRFEGRNLLALSPRELRAIRGNRIAMIFQEPMTSLNPVFTVGVQIAESVRLHRGWSRREALEYATGMLEKVGLPSPSQRVKEYPHQLSGGMRQRVMIAMALACNPRVLLADEPTTALDVTVQAQIVELMQALQEEYGTAIVLISHDMGLVAESCGHVAVMYAGEIVEQAPAARISAQPMHPYTRGLLASIPRLRRDRSIAKEKRLTAIPGVVPAATRVPPGCAFHARCRHAMPRCTVDAPDAIAVAADHRVRCWLHQTT
jgi:peptide/nickel transport system ATP-binding protein/oligopeptide transport system ATP-binding protein